MNLPNRLTVGRLFLCVLFVAALELDKAWAGKTALVIFVVASITDWLDGHLARKWGMITDLGKLLDPLADKILISAAFIGFVEHALAPGWIVTCIVSREFLITGLRMLAAAKGVVLAAEKAGKHKTVSQMVTAVFALVLLAFPNDLFGLDPVWLEDTFLRPMLWFTLFITLYSGGSYFYKNWSILFGEGTQA
jgi:CDP-diacylglycerol--glycerol-3-phosphate 3-phosphatidyltransferase